MPHVGGGAGRVHNLCQYDGHCLIVATPLPASAADLLALMFSGCI
jgi:hypothetical protein